MAFRMEDILQVVQLSESQWIVAGLVTSNDYSQQLYGQNLSKNLVVEQIKEFDKSA
jgi:hypothetical protein